MHTDKLTMAVRKLWQRAFRYIGVRTQVKLAELLVKSLGSIELAGIWRLIRHGI